MSATPTYNHAYLDETTKRMLRRTILKAVAIPGFQVPFAAREMPLPYGWGTGGIQLTAALIGGTDVLKVIDQGDDHSTNAVSIRRFFERTAEAATTASTTQATLIQTRHRIPETPLTESQILVYQVPRPDPLRSLEEDAEQRSRMHAYGDYGRMRLLLYEQITRSGRITQPYNYPAMVEGGYLMSPSPIPAFDNPRLDNNPALQVFGAGREQRIYAIPPYTHVASLDFIDYPFAPERPPGKCALCGSGSSWLDALAIDDAGNRQYVCSDTDYCQRRQTAPAEEVRQ